MDWLGGVLTAGAQPRRVKKERSTVYASSVASGAARRPPPPPAAPLAEAPLAPVPQQPLLVDAPQVQPTAPQLLSNAITTPSEHFPRSYSDPVPSSYIDARPRPQKKTPKKPKARNVLVLGKQHAGKSAFINTYRRAITGGDNWATAPVGRAATRGTDCYEPYYDQAGGEEVKWVLVDTAGRRFGKAMESTPEEAELYGKMIEGLAWKADLMNDQAENYWRRTDVVPENAIDHVVFVVPVTDIVKDKGILHLNRFETSIARVRDLASRFKWWEKQLGNAPFVVVTHMDTMDEKYALPLASLGLSRTVESMVRDELNQIVHRNRIFCVTNPEDPMDLSPHTEKVLKQLHQKIVMDIASRTSSVLQGRNSKWKGAGVPEEEEVVDEIEQQQPPPQRQLLLQQPGAGGTNIAGSGIEVLDDPVSPVTTVTTPLTSADHKKRFGANSKTGGGALLWTMPKVAPPKKIH